MRLKSADKIDLNDLRDRIIKAKDQGEKIISHYRKMEEYYEEWEAVMAQLDKEINLAAQQHGLTKEEVSEYDALSDIFS